MENCLLVYWTIPKSYLSQSNRLIYSGFMNFPNRRRRKINFSDDEREIEPGWRRERRVERELAPRQRKTAKQNPHGALNSDTRRSDKNSHSRQSAGGRADIVSLRRISARSISIFIIFERLTSARKWTKLATECIMQFFSLIRGVGCTRVMRFVHFTTWMDFSAEIVMKIFARWRLLIWI